MYLNLSLHYSSKLKIIPEDAFRFQGDDFTSFHEHYHFGSTLQVGKELHIFIHFKGLWNILILSILLLINCTFRISLEFGLTLVPSVKKVPEKGQQFVSRLRMCGKGDDCFLILLAFPMFNLYIHALWHVTLKFCPFLSNVFDVKLCHETFLAN